VYAYHQSCYEARERIAQRRREADAERIIRRQARARRQRRRRAQLAEALEQLIGAGRQAARLRTGA
jgi:hypothetical protein